MLDRCSFLQTACALFCLGGLDLSCATAPVPAPVEPAPVESAPAATPAPDSASAGPPTPASTTSVTVDAFPAPSVPADGCPELPPESTGRIEHLPAHASDEPAPRLRLPEGIKPTQEALSLTLDPTQARFSGIAAIALQIDQPRSVIWLHGQNLRVSEAHLDLQGARLAAEYQQVNEGGLVRVRVPCLVSGRALLSISWDAAYDDHLAGLYIAREKDIPYVYSQFEAIDARRAFPAFDDPVFKIPWDIELVVPADDVAVSNASIVTEGPSESGRRRIRFGTTAPLPTYLLAFAVGPFDVVVPPPLPQNAVRDHPLQLRGIAPKGRGPGLQFAMGATAALLPRLETWFGIPYPYEKLDQIAVPDFTYGAMENAGAIMYRESDLLYAQGTSSGRSLASIAETMAHELAHQWFGDLVTLRWWTDAWLNESFATWMEAKIVEDWLPELRAETDQRAAIHKAMSADATTTARTIRKPVDDEANIWNQFDSLTYEKGAGLLSMMESWIGAEPFRKGIQAYLRAHANASASSEDLFAALDEAAGRDVKGPLRTFLEQPGVPLVRARVACGGKVRVLFEQTRDLPAGAKATETMRAQRWQIPVCARGGVRGDVRSACTLLTEVTGELELGGTRCPDWVTANAGGVGYYRVALAPNDLDNLLKARAQLTEPERASAASDLADAYFQGRMQAAEVLQDLAAFAHDREPEVSGRLMEVLADARDNILDPNLRSGLEVYARSQYRAVASRLGWNEQGGEGTTARAERVAVLTFLANVARDPLVRKEGARLGRAYANVEQESFDATAVVPELGELALGLAAQESGAEFRQKLIARLANSEESPVRWRILNALGEVRDPAVTPDLLKLTFDPQLRKSERERILLLQLAHEETRVAATVWLVAHWDALAAQLSDSQLALVVRRLASVGCDRGTVTAAESFLRPRADRIASAPLELQQGLETARACIARREAQGRSLAGFFSSSSARH